MEDQNYTIKDIARMAGVSAGTVDRVLHNRGDVSPQSKAKVQKVLDEIHYQPNVFAIGLAAKKKYSFVCLIPYYYRARLLAFGSGRHRAGTSGIASFQCECGLSLLSSGEQGKLSGSVSQS